MSIIIIFTAICVWLTAYTAYGRKLFIKHSSVNRQITANSFVYINETQEQNAVEQIKHACKPVKQQNRLAAALFGWLPVLLWITVRSVSESVRNSSYPNRKRLTASLLVISMLTPLASGITSGAEEVPEADIQTFAVTDTLSTAVTNTDDSGDGSLRQAIANASDGDTVTFAIESDGTQVITLGSVLTVGSKSITIDASMQGAAVELIVGGEFRHISTDGNIILSGLTFNGDNKGGGVYMYNYKSLIAENCNFLNNTASVSGGGIYMFGAAKVKNCIFDGNTANHGGGIYAGSYDITVYDCEFINNKAANVGGGIYAKGKTELTDTVFNENEATSSWGGGIFSYNGFTANNCTFKINKAGGNGGGAAVESSEAVIAINDCIFEGNESGNWGGGVFSVYGPVTAEGSIFKDNIAVRYGAGIAVDWSGAVNATDCTFEENTVTGTEGLGGGIGTWNGDVTANNCNFIENSAWEGGGIRTNFSDVTATDCKFINNKAVNSGTGAGLFAGKNAYASECTFTGNESGWSGGGIYAGLNITVQNSSFSTNKAQCGSAIYTDDINYLGEYNSITVINSTFVDNITGRNDYGTIQAYDVYLFHCTVAKNNGVGVYGGDNIYAYNCIIDNNSEYQTYIPEKEDGYIIVGGIIDTISGGANLIGNIDGSYFSENTLTFGYIMPLPDSTIKTAAPITDSDISSVITDGTQSAEILAALEYDQAGNERGDTVTYGAVEPTAKTWVVKNSDDELGKPYTLRSVIGEANNDTGSDYRVITFASTVTSTIELTLGNINPQDNIIIYGRTDSGGAPEIVISGENNTSRAFLHTGSGTFTLYGLHIMNFKEEETKTDGGDNNGGAIRMNGATLVVENCNFTNNKSNENGGAIDASNGGVIAKNCVFFGNTTIESGGAINTDTTADLINCVFLNNEAEVSGGGVFANSSDITVNNCAFISNTAARSGGGIYSNGNVNAAECIFIENESTWGSGVFTGDIWNGNEYVEGNAILNNCSFKNNISADSGGGIFACGSVTATDVIFTGNEAVDWGGGICTEFGDITVTGGTFENNSSENLGGGIYADSGEVSMQDCVFSNNSAVNSGGAVYAGVSVTAEDCEFTENTASGGCGGGICASSDVSAENCEFTQNEATGGGGIQAGSNVIAVNCTFAGNEAITGNGGGIFTNFGTVTITNGIFTKNTSSYDGGGIYANIITAVNSMFTLNETNNPESAALDAYSKITLYHCTVAGNTGNGIYIYADSKAYAYNSIIAGNTAKQALYEGTITGDSLIEYENNLTYAKIFGVNTVDSDGFIKVLGGGKADGKVTALSNSNGISDEIIALLAKDLSGAARSASGNATYGALETPEDSVSGISASINRNYGDELRLSDSDGAAITYANGGTGTLPLTDPDLTVTSDGYTVSSTGQIQLPLAYLGATGVLTVNIGKIGATLELESESDGTHNRDITLTVTLTGRLEELLSDGTVIFKDNGTELDTLQTDSDGKAILSLTSLSDGEHYFIAVFEGNTAYFAASDGITITTTPHTYGEWGTATATCESDGTKTRTCNICLQNDVERVAALGHTWDSEELYEDTPATCTSDGLKIHSCTVCEESEDEIISALRHDWAEDFTTDTPATCTEAGSKSKHCIRYGDCGAGDEVTEISANGHAWGSWEVINYPTETDDGSEERICSICGEPDTRDIHIQTHTFGNWEETTSPTCTETGIETRSCNDCGKIQTQLISLLGHDYSEDWTTDTEPACTETGSESHRCSRCEATDGAREITAAGHSYGDWETVAAATCTEAGEEKHICAVCENEENQPITALGHDFELGCTVDIPAACTETGSESHHCSRCDETDGAREIAAAGHSYGNWVTVSAATSILRGLEERICSVCGKAETREIPAQGGGAIVITPDTNTNTSSENTTTIAPDIKDTTNNSASDSTQPITSISDNSVSYYEGIVSKDAEKNGNAPEIKLDTNVEKLIDIVFEPEEIERIAAGENAKVFVKVEDISERISAEDKTLIDENLGDFTLGLYLDISLFKTIGGDETFKLTQLGEVISITIEIPEELRADGRSYRIIRIHDGEVEIIDGIYNYLTGEFTFETDRFSTYALIMIDDFINETEQLDFTDGDTDTEEDDSAAGGNPKTGYSAVPALIGIFSAGIMIVTVRKHKKREK